MARKYTEAVHAKRLIKMLERPDPCACCPAGKSYDSKVSKTLKTTSTYKEICVLCLSFVGLTPSDNCPCTSFINKKEAIKRTRKALKEKGYI